MGLESEFRRLLAYNPRAHVEMARRLGRKPLIDDDDGSDHPVRFRLHYRSSRGTVMWALGIIGMVNERGQTAAIDISKTNSAGSRWLARLSFGEVHDGVFSVLHSDMDPLEALHGLLLKMGEEWCNPSTKISTCLADGILRQ